MQQHLEMVTITPNPNRHYSLLPTQKQRGSTPPTGLVKIDNNMRPPARRLMTEGYLNQRMPRNNTIAINKHYVEKVLDNPYTPPENRRAVIDYIERHPDRFIRLCETTECEEVNDWVKRKNGNAKMGFVAEIKKKVRKAEVIFGILMSD